MACILPNPRRVGYIVPIHGPLDGPSIHGLTYTPSIIIHLEHILFEFELNPKHF